MTDVLRQGRVERKTKETQIELEISLDGKGTADLRTGVPFLDHMLTLFSVHGLFDLKIHAAGDLEIDAHHTVEDIGICLGDALSTALGDRKTIRRYGFAVVPMDEACASVALDLSNRPYLMYQIPPVASKVGQFDTELVPEFFRAVSQHGGITLHIQVHYGSNTHHILEAIFKAWGRALDEATRPDERRTGVPSSKGSL
jgi:imidazoleglycerol-phosphate dehydratase